MRQHDDMRPGRTRCDRTAPPVPAAAGKPGRGRASGG